MERETRIGAGPTRRHQPPRVAPNAVMRGRLIEPLRGRFERRLTVIVAGPGFGKTTLLGQAMAENDIERLGHDVWLRLHERDQRAEHLLGGVADALGSDGARADLDQIINEVWRLAPGSVALIFDDAHHLGEADEAWAVLRSLLDRLPANGSLVISGRFAPLLPVTDRVDIDSAVVLGEADLAFTDEEIATLATLRHLPAELVPDLPRWPALASLTGAVGHGASIEFLWDEVLSTLAPERRHLLAAAALFGEIDEELVDALGQGWSLDQLVEGLPLVDATEGATFRLHDLWIDALSNVLTVDDRRRAHRAGARILLDRGDLLRAAASFALASDERGLGEVVIAYARRPTIGAHADEVDRLRALLPLSMSEQAAARYLDAARLSISDDRLAAAQFAAVAEQAAATGDLELETLARWRVFQFEDIDAPGGARPSKRMYELVDAGIPMARAVAAFVESRQAQERGEVDTSIALLDGLAAFDEEQRDMSFAIRILDLGRPESLPATLSDVLASDIGDIYAAQAVWLQGSITPVDAWPIARDLPARAATLPIVTRVSVNCVAITIALSAGAHDDALALLDQTRRLAPAAANMVQLFVGVADALVRFTVEGEEAAAAALRDLTGRVPLGLWPERPYLYALAALRALAPGAESLDRCDLGPSFATAVRAGAALTALRAGDERKAAALPWATPTLLEVHVPGPMLAELAVSALPDPHADVLLRRLPHARNWLTRVAERPTVLRSRVDLLLHDLPARPDHDLRIGLLGGLSLTRSDGRPVPGWDRRERVRHLLALLAVSRDPDRTLVAGRLWPELAPDRAMANLRVNLHHLQAAIQPDRAPEDPPWFLQSVDSRLVLNRDGVVVDIDELDQAMVDAERAEGAGRGAEALERYRRVQEIAVGDLLPDLEADWVSDERRRLREVVHRSVVRSGELVLARGEPEEALRLAVRSERMDPTAERGLRLIIRCHLALGSVTSAREAAGLLRSRLADLGLDPEHESTVLLGRLGP